MLSMLKEENGQYSCRRVLAFLLVIAGFFTLPFSLKSFISIIGNGWVSVLVFSPFAFCVVMAILLLYFTTISDINAIISKLRDKP